MVLPILFKFIHSNDDFLKTNIQTFSALIRNPFSLVEKGLINLMDTALSVE